MKKNKNQCNQQRAKKRALYKSKRKKKIRQQKHQAKNQSKRLERKVEKFSSPGLKVIIRDWWMKLMCRIGRHKWALMSGRPGMHKYFCPRCSKLSDEVWTDEMQN